MRTGIRKILDKTPDIVVVGEANDGVQALDLVETLSPDVLVLDVEMPNLNGIQVAQKLGLARSTVRVLVLSAYDDRAHIHGMLEAGVAGYLTKDEGAEALVKAVRGVARGDRSWLSKRVAAKLASEIDRARREKKDWSPREMELLRLIAARKSNRQIAEDLGASESEVLRELSRLYQRMNASSPLELVERAREAGLI